MVCAHPTATWYSGVPAFSITPETQSPGRGASMPMLQLPTSPRMSQVCNLPARHAHRIALSLAWSASIRISRTLRGCTRCRNSPSQRDVESLISFFVSVKDTVRRLLLFVVGCVLYVCQHCADVQRTPEINQNVNIKQTHANTRKKWSAKKRERPLAGARAHRHSRTKSKIGAPATSHKICTSRVYGHKDELDESPQ